MTRLFATTISLIFLLGAMLSFAFAQRPRYRPQVHELSIQLFSSNHIPAYNDAYKSAPPLSYNALNGIRYAYHLDAFNAFRGGLFYRRASYSNPVEATQYFETYGAQKTDIELKLGYMRKLNLQKLQLYAGVDAVLSYAMLNEFGTRMGGGGFERKEAYPAYGINFGVGIRYFLNKNWSIALENEFYYLKNNRTPFGEGTDYLIFPEKETGLNLLSFQISYHFKRMRKSCTCGKPGS